MGIWFAICCHCLVSRHSASSPLTLWFLHSCSASAFFSSLSAFTLIPSTISHLWNQPCRAQQCSRQYTDAVLTLLRSFIKCDGSAHTHTYIYIHWTAVIKISCLATLGNYGKRYVVGVVETISPDLFSKVVEKLGVKLRKVLHEWQCCSVMSLEALCVLLNGKLSQSCNVHIKK